MMRWRRCELCGSRLPVKMPKRSAVPPVLLWDDSATRSSSFAAYLCDNCSARNQWARIDTEQRWSRESAALRERCADWLRAAPLMTDLPAPIGASTLDGTIFGFSPFVEIIDLETAAEEFAGCRRGFRPQPLPATYHDVLSAHHDEPPVRITEWAGSVYRLPDGRVALHWRPRRAFTADY
jgi:hypothetical protein